MSHGPEVDWNILVQIYNHDCQYLSNLELVQQFEAAFQILLYQITRKLESSNGKQVIYSAKTLIYYPVKLLVAGSIITNDIS